MGNFVNIQTVFNNTSDRTIESLNTIYDDHVLLVELINGLTIDFLNIASIKGKKVLLKPNWVKHLKRDTDKMCLCTHNQFILAALEVVLDKEPASVIIGDAPIQGCIWDKLVTLELTNSVKELSARYNIPVTIKDFRRVTFDPSKNNPIQERNPLTEYIIFNLGKESFLEPITRPDRKLFRVTNYSPDRLAESHTAGIHKYCITKELFNADVVISLPKVKTHQKTGITAALKNLVGLNGDKDYLPHHRLGGTGFGGDCYPGKNYLRYFSELSLDQGNRKQGKTSYWFWTKLSSAFWRLSLPGKEHHISAAWHGNDTTWRMVLDLNKIAIYGKEDGTISTEPQRILFSLCDGIIGGQGDGPLRPEPLALGIISFTNHSAMNDVCMGKLMGFDIKKIPLLNTSFILSEKENIDLFLNNNLISIKDLEKSSIVTLPPPGWDDYLNNIKK